MILRDQIFERGADLPRERVDVPEWGLALWVRTVTATERDDFEARSLTRRGKRYETNFKDMRARLLVLTVVDEKGERAFRDEDLAKVGGLSALVADRLYDVACRLNGLGPADVEGLEKN